MLSLAIRIISRLLLIIFQRSAHFDRRSRDLRERGYHHSERVTPRMHSSGEISGPQRFDVLSSTVEL